MSKLSDLRSKGETVILSNETELLLEPMTIGEEADVTDFLVKDNIGKAIALLVKKAIKRADPEATDDEIETLNKEDLKKITQVVLKINKLEGDEKKKSNTNSVSKKG